MAKSVILCSDECYKYVCRCNYMKNKEMTNLI